jgi:hypothetical protein
VAKEWLAAREVDLLPVPYYHLVFTLPAPVSNIAYQNKAAIYDILFKASAETLITIAADPRHLGARVGITSVLHTWGSALTHHPHVHMIVPGGRQERGRDGRDLEARWRRPARDRAPTFNPNRRSTWRSRRSWPRAARSTCWSTMRVT